MEVLMRNEPSRFGDLYRLQRTYRGGLPKSCQTRSPLGFSHRGEKPQVFKGNTQACNFMRSPNTWKMMGHVTKIWKTTLMISC